MNFDNVTSEEMERLLFRLGFHLDPSSAAPRVFANPEYDAVLLLPAAGKERFARVEHLMTLRKVADERGLADNATFHKLLDEVRQQSSEALAKAS